MVTESYVSFECAKLLKEKGFNWECATKRYYPENPIDECDPNGLYAPTQAMAMRWLREVHKIDIGVIIDTNRYRGWFYSARIWENHSYKHTVLRQGYEEACEAAIKYCLEKL